MADANSAYLHHVTLNTGHVVRQPRSVLGAPVQAAFAELLDSLLQGGRPAVPGFAGYVAQGTQWGRDLLVTVIGLSSQAPVITTGVCLRSRSSRRLWRAMHDKAIVPLATVSDQPAPPPWVADLLWPTATLHPDALEWTGDWSRCLGWTWVEYDR